ncbi:hypothetical protein L0222_00880 [bacterium]|nr:hypothetical protein [bacterium]
MILVKETEGKRQIYHISYPKGELASITNDFNDYSGVSLTKDSNSLVTTQRTFNSVIWRTESIHPNTATQVTSGSDVDDGGTGLSWTPNGRIIFSSKEPAGGAQLWLMNSDGINRKRITREKPDKYWPVMSSDSRYIAYMSEDGQIWQMDGDGSNSKILVSAKQARLACFPRFSPDNRWIMYSTYGVEKQELLKLSLENRKETVLASHKFIYGGAISADGKQIAYVYMDPERSNDLMLNIISFEQDSLMKTFKMESGVFPGGRIHWTPDGNGIAYIRFEKGISNIYVQPIDGSPSRHLTNYTTDAISNFSWSLDGKQIAFSRGKDSSDIVLIQDVP